MAKEEKKKLSEMTKAELVKEEIRREERARKKAITDQILRFVGVLTSIFLFIMIFSQLSLTSWFSFVNGSANTGFDFWKGIFESPAGEESIIYKIFYNVKGAAIFSASVMTLIQVSLAVVVGFLVAYYIKDAIGVLKSIFNLGKNITTELGVGIKEGVQDIAIGLPKKKSLFGDEKDENKEEKPKKSKRGRKPKEKPAEKPVDPIELLTAEQTDLVLQGKATVSDFVKPEEPVKVEEPVTAPVVEEPVRKSLFERR